MSPSRREYAAAEARLRESIEVRRCGLPHDYLLREHDLTVMREAHERAGGVLPERGFRAWRRLFSGRGGGVKANG